MPLKDVSEMKPQYTYNAGDQFPWGPDSTRIVLAVRPYTGKYPQWFNVVLVLSSPQTRSGTIEMVHNDLPLRRQMAAAQSL